MNSFFTGLLFLTRLPIKYNADWTPEACGKSVKYFTLIGTILGLINAAAAYLFVMVLPSFHINIAPALGAFLLLLVSTASTGALHCDGYTDTMDGILSGRPRDRMLEIMKDSHVGAHGVASLIMLLLGKYSAIMALYTYSRPDLPAFYVLCSALFLMPVAGRLAMVIGITLFPYARKDGLGMAFSLYSDKKSLIAASFVTIIALFINYYTFYKGIAALIIIIIFALVFCRHVTNKLGGLTGDVYGAVTELSELLLLIVFSII